MRRIPIGETCTAMLIKVRMDRKSIMYKEILMPIDSTVEEILEMFYVFLKVPARHINFKQKDKRNYVVSYYSKELGYKYTKLEICKTASVITMNAHYSTLVHHATHKCNKQRVDEIMELDEIYYEKFNNAIRSSL